MKKTLYIIAIAFAAAAAVSCDSFLDRQEDEQLTEPKIWASFSYTRQYFLNCMGYLPDDANAFYNSVPYYGASDEASMTWNYSYRYINFGSWNATTIPNDYFNNRYMAIRDCNIFLKNAPGCSDAILVGDEARQAQLQLWYWCVRWARAYTYFLLMRDYGPVFLVGDEPMDFTESTQALQMPRSSWDECVKYVVDEMTECAQRLPVAHTSANMGLPTQGAALAVISRLLLYSARELFNSDSSIYKTVRNPDGGALFPVSFDKQKWYEAAKAARDVIDLGVYKLYRTEEDNPYLNYYGVFQEKWNDEIIYSGGGYQNRWALGVHTTPTDIASGEAYGGWGPTQSSVDSYAMYNGRYPITGYDRSGAPIVDSRSGYPAADREFVTGTLENPFLTALECTYDQSVSVSPLMYHNREPRFYVTVYFPGTGWKHGDAVGVATFADGGPGHTTHDYPITGYLVNKWYDHTNDSYQGQWGNVTFPTFRYAETLLNYIEATLECEKYGLSDEYVNMADAMTYWDDLRSRSGLPSIQDVYPGATNSELIDLIHRERQVELAQEGHRYFDVRTWKIATEVCDGPVYGLDTSVRAAGSTDTNVPAAMWTRKVMEKRVFTNTHYLYPFLQRELDRNKLLTQNLGW